MSIKIGAGIEPQSATLGVTHEDRFGRGGFIVVTTGALLEASSGEINAQVPQPRRKVGMRIHDVSTAQDYECVSVGTLGASIDDGVWKVHVVSGGTY